MHRVEQHHSFYVYSSELAGVSLCHAVLIIRATLRHGSSVKPGINSLIGFNDRLVLGEPAKRSDAQNFFAHQKMTNVEKDCVGLGGS